MFPIKLRILLIILFPSVLIGQDTIFQTTITRLNGGNPIIDQSWFANAGITNYEAENINGPCLVRIPDWVSPANRVDNSAVYYLYFGHHSGDYIRMAWSANIEGPYHLFNAGNNNDPAYPGRGVFDLGSSDEVKWTGGARLYNHIASPQVLLDSVNQQFILLLHGKANGAYDNDFSTNNQRTLAATSPYGLNFNCPSSSGATGGVGGGVTNHGLRNQILSNAYLKSFVYEGTMYGFTNYGVIWKSPSATEPWLSTGSPSVWSWEEGHTSTNPVYEDMKVLKYIDPERGDILTPRHFATRIRPDGHTLEVWYTCRGEAPERVYRTTLDLRQDWLFWDTDLFHEEMIRPELAWEGVNLPVQPSLNGSETNVNQIRDPELFQDNDGSWYLLYSAMGEEGIGIASLHDTTIVQPSAPNYLQISSVSATDDDGNVPENVLDYNYSTRWSSNVNGVELTFDLGSIHTVQGIEIAFYLGDQRQSNFELQYSTDGINYTSVSNFNSSGSSLGLENFNLGGVSARYIKYIGFGNSVNAWNSITEAKIHE